MKTRKPIGECSRQYRWQQRKRRFRQCIICAEPIPKELGSFLCLKHAIAKRERQRKLVGAGKRYKSATYRLEEKLKEQGRL